MRLDSVVGQPHVTKVLKGLLNDEVFPCLLLFRGPHGVGKTFTAKALADDRNAELVEAVPEQVATLFRYPVERRVILLDSAEGLERIFERIPGGTTVVVTTTEAPDWLVSRALTFDFRSLLPNDILALVRQIEADDFPTELAWLVAEKAHGDIHRAIHGLTQVKHDYKFSVEKSLLTLVKAALSSDLTSVMHLAEDITKHSGDVEGVVLTLTEILRDLLVLKAGGAVEAAGELKPALATLVPVPTLLAALKLLWTFKGKVSSALDVQVMCALVAGTLAPQKIKEVEIPAPAPINGQRDKADRPLSLAEMMKRVGS